jgi:hypothetical protein
MAILRTCFTKGCGIKTLGRFCLDCETASGITAPPAAEVNLASAATRELTPAA